MLIIDKKEDIGIYQALGMTKEKIISIFKLEGNLITGFGALIGLALGTILCLLQEYYGFITLGNGSYIVSAYPVKVIASDILIYHHHGDCHRLPGLAFPGKIPREQNRQIINKDHAMYKLLTLSLLSLTLTLLPLTSKSQDKEPVV